MGFQTKSDLSENRDRFRFFFLIPDLTKTAESVFAAPCSEARRAFYKPIYIRAQRREKANIKLCTKSITRDITRGGN